MPSATKRIDGLIGSLNQRYSGAEGVHDKNVILAAQILADLCNSDFRIADRVDEAIRASEVKLGTLDTETLSRIDATVPGLPTNQKEVAIA